MRPLRTTAALRHGAAVLLIAVSVALVAGCGGGGGGSSPAPGAPQNTVSGIEISGVVDEPSTVTLDGHADADATADDVFSFALPLNGTALPRDPGNGAGATDLTVTLEATDSTGNVVDTLVTISPPH